MDENTLKILSYDIQDFLGVRLGIKPCARIDTTIERFNKLKNICKDNGLECEYKSNKAFNYINKDSIIVYIAKDKKYIDKLYEYDLKVDILNIGRLLGYPECCISSFVNSILKNNKPPSIVNINKNSKKSYYILNNLYNFDDVVRENNMDVFMKYIKIRNRSKIYRYISHIPCSYDCEESKKIAISIRNEMIKECPDIVKKIDYTLKGPVLFLNRFSWLSLEGNVIGNTINYTKVKDIKTLFPEDIKNKIEKHNKITINNDSINFDDGEKIKINLNLINFRD